jgi:hypothetical protein
MLGEIRGSGGIGQALESRPNRHRDHVLRKMLAVADSSVAACRNDIDKTIIHHDFNTNAWVQGQKRSITGGRMSTMTAPVTFNFRRPRTSA